MTSPPYQGVILAAGHGARMGPFGAELPKPIVPICNRPLLAYQLDYMRAAGIEDVFVVIGHLGHRITRVLGDGSAFGVRIEYVEQRQRLGIAHAVGQLESRVNRPFLLMLGDIFFEIDDIPRMIEELEGHSAAAVLAVKEENDVDAVKRNFSVSLHNDGTVKRVIEKPRHVANMLKGCGLYLFDLPIFDAIRRTPRTAMRDEYELTDSIQILIDYEYPVRTAPVVTWDINLTYTYDLVSCCLHQMRKLGVESVVGEECSIVDGVTLRNTVVGDRVTIRRPITLERCVVLSGVTLEDDRNYADAVLALPDQQTGAPGLIEENTHGNS